jgi:alpha-L-rhamnosidase
MKKGWICLIILSAFIQKAIAQKPAPLITQKTWDAYWISSKEADPHTYAVLYFRKEFSLAAKPGSFIIHVSADNRYKLFVNGELVSLGPARSEIYNWQFETVDIAPFLKSGNNIIGAIVWQFGEDAPEAQISYRTAFILQGEGERESILNTNKTWNTLKDKSYSPLNPELIYSYYVAGPGEQIDYNQFPTGWNKSGYDAGSWKTAMEISKGVPKGVFTFSQGWMLVPRNIPAMELTAQNFKTVSVNKGQTFPPGFPDKSGSFRVAPNQKINFILDQGQLTNAYPLLEFSKGKNARISIGYAEALYIDEGSQKDWRAQNKKGNRNDIINKRFVGVRDMIIPDGKDKQTFSTLSYRTFRYVQVSIETGDEELIIDGFHSLFTGYPFTLNAGFETGNDTLDKIFSTGWHTARLCAMETYMDCPYYEQLQYAGDTRIQSLVSLYNSGDDKLMRNAISLLDQSRMAEGITLSRYPTRNSQQIPPFALWWIGMLHDYWKYRPDANFVQEHLAGMRQVLWFFSKYQEPDGSLKGTPYWNFTDWCESPGWHEGVAPIGENGHSAAMDLQLLWAFQLASELENKLGTQAKFKEFREAAILLKSSIRKRYFSAGVQLFADTQEKNIFSQHVNALAILTQTATLKETEQIAQNILNNTKLAPATIYFKYYVHQALVKAGLGNNYLDWLEIWKENLQMGMTTWAEISDINAARSDCHAWGSSPNIEFFRTVLGIDSDSPGFRSVRIEPRPGKLEKLKGTMPHPAGMLSVEYRVKGQLIDATINLPPGTAGKFIWMNRVFPLKAGLNTISTLSSSQPQPAIIKQ